ncbi:Formin-like protein [Melia azedarach]|uniref:Formin-like protein n=1 Tax=Melia azedarach TaxID=155640 RepID=A0ACC1XNH1_MELAZ|nr:Formin-like protein [Melia azedarach]
MPQQNTAKTIAATAAITLVIVGVALLIFRKFAKCRWKSKINSSFRREETTVTHEEFKKFKGKVKDLIVDENGQEVLYMRKLEDGELKATFPKIMLNPSYEEEDEEKRMNFVVQRNTKPRLLLNDPSDLSCHKKKTQPILQNLAPPPPVSKPLLKQPPPPPPPTQTRKVPAARPPVPPPAPPPPPTLRHSLPVLPPPVPVKGNPMPSIPPPRTLNMVSPMKPPPTPRVNAEKNKERAAAEESSTRTVGGHGEVETIALG